MVLSVTTDGGLYYRSHTFTGSGSFVVEQISTTLPNEVDYMVVAGGGAGATDTGGGGGAGGMKTGTGKSVSTQSYTVTIGGGGWGRFPYPSQVLVLMDLIQYLII